jgi:carbohydrate-selective porin OprB
MALSVFKALIRKGPPRRARERAQAALCWLLLSGALLFGLAPTAHAQATPAADAASSAIAGNPGAVNIVAGTGALGRLLGLDPESGLRLGGVLVRNGNYLISGGNAPGKTSFNNLLVADLDADLDKLAQIPGASFGTAPLRFDGQPTNRQAGIVTGYNGLTGATARPDGTLRTLVAAISLLRPAGGANRKMAGWFSGFGNSK